MQELVNILQFIKAHGPEGIALAVSIILLFTYLVLGSLWELMNR